MEIYLANAKSKGYFLSIKWSKALSTLDLWAGYHHIPLDESSIPQTAFTLPFGIYEYIKVPYGLMQAPAYFPELMTDILKDFSFAITYLDDILIFSRTPEEHLNHIKQVFENIQNAHLSMKLSKCHLFTNKIQYLRHILSTTGIRPLPSKTQAKNNMHPPTIAQQACTFLGLVIYYRKFIKNFAKMAKPLTTLNSPESKIWMDTSTLYSLLDATGSSYTSTYLMLSWSNKMIHSLHRCIRHYMWSTSLTRPW